MRDRLTLLVWRLGLYELGGGVQVWCPKEKFLKWRSPSYLTAIPEHAGNLWSKQPCQSPGRGFSADKKTLTPVRLHPLWLSATRGGRREFFWSEKKNRCPIFRSWVFDLFILVDLNWLINQREKRSSSLCGIFRTTFHLHQSKGCAILPFLPSIPRLLFPVINTFIFIKAFSPSSPLLPTCNFIYLFQRNFFPALSHSVT